MKFLKAMLLLYLACLLISAINIPVVKAQPPETPLKGKTYKMEMEMEIGGVPAGGCKVTGTVFGLHIPEVIPPYGVTVTMTIYHRNCPSFFGARCSENWEVVVGQVEPPATIRSVDEREMEVEIVQAVMMARVISHSGTSWQINQKNVRYI